MSYEVKVKEVGSMRIVYMNYRGRLDGANKLFPRVFRSVMGRFDGPPFFNYISMDPETKTGELELCLASSEEPRSDGVMVRELASRKVLSTIHRGPYEEIFQAYKAIEDHALKNNIRISPPFQEIFIKGPSRFLKGDPNKYITEIQFTIVEDQDGCY